MNPAALNSSSKAASPELPWYHSVRRVRATSLPGAIKDYTWREPAPSWLRSAALAVAAVGSAFLLQRGLRALGSDLGVYLPYVGSILAAGWYGGFRAALVATIISTLVVQWTALEPRYHFWVHSRDDALHLSVFLLEGFFISLFMRVVQQFRDDRAYSLACQKADKARAEQSEQRLRFALEAARMVAWEWDLIANQISYSSEGAGALGLAAEGAAHDGLADLVHPDDLADLAAAVEASLKGKQEYRAEYRLRQPNGTYLWVQDRGQVRRNSSGQPVRLTGVLLDITHRRQAEEALRRSQEALQRANETLRSILMAFPDVMFVVDRQGRIRMRNVSGQRFLEAMGSPLALPESIDKPLQEMLSGSAEEKSRQVLDFRMNGQDRYYSLRIAPIHSPPASALGAAVVLQDVTEFRLLDDIKTNLVATVSHEVKTPLTSVQTALQVLQCKSLGPLNQQQEEMVLIAREEADRLLRTLNALLDLTRFEEGMLGMQFEAVSCSTLVQDAVEEVRLAAATAQVRLITRVADDLPDVEVDRQRIVHVLVNFLTNAVKYSPPGSEVRLEACKTESGQIRMSVQDQGPGIAQEYQHRLFDKFFRVPDNSQHGVGLGLSIAREFIHAHGGTIGVHSRLGQGSEFYFVIDPKPSGPFPGRRG